MKLHDLSLGTRVTIGVLAMVLAGTATLLLVENSRLRDAYLNEQRAHLEQDFETETLRLNQAINTLRQDVLFLSNTPPVSGIVRATFNRGYDARDGNTRARWEQRLQQIFSAFSSAHPDYYKIRFIGVADGGREIVRVDNRGGGVEVTPSDRLQAKGGRDFFKTTLGLREGQVSLSEFDLNQDWGVIEQPYRPSLRATTPVFTPSGEIFGIVVINLEVGNLLKLAVSDLPGIQTYTTNSDGQYLLHPDAQQAFKFELGGKNKITTDFPFIKTMFDPQAADYLQLQAAATKRDSSLFAAKRIRFDPGNQSRFLLLMHYLPGAVAAEQIVTIPANTLLYEFMAMLLAGSVAVLALRRTFSPLKQITLAADKIAAGDQNTLLLPTDGGEIGSLTNSLNTMLTRLAQRERLLRESETRYRRLHESMVDAYVMVDMSGRLIESNHTYRDMLGYSAEELQRLTYIDLMPQRWHESEARIVEDQVIPNGYSQVYEKEYIRKNGTVFPVELKTFLLRDKNNQPEAMWAIVRDITERKQAEALTQQFGSLLQGSFNEIYMFDADSLHFILTSEGAEKNLGYTDDELNQLTPLDLKPSFTRESFEQLIAPLWTGEQQLLHFESVHRRKDGTTYPVEVRLQLMPTTTTTTTFLAIVQDITERKRAMELLRKSSEEITDLYNHAPCGYHSLGKDGTILMINDTELAWLGYTRDEVVGKMKWSDLITSASQPAFRESFPLFKKVGFVRDFEIEMLRKNGTTFTGLINATAIYDAGGNYLMSRSTVADITARKRAEEVLREHQIEMEMQNEELQQTQVRLDIARARYFDLYDFAPVGYCTLSKMWLIMESNFTAATLLGVARKALVKRRLSKFISKENQDVFYLYCKQLVNSTELQECELRMTRNDGTQFWAHLAGTAAQDEDGAPVFRIVMSDITGRKQIEQRLRDLTAHLEFVREEEKSNIAREIHDDLGGTLTVLNMETHHLEAELSKDKNTLPLLEHVESMSQLVNNAVVTMRRIITGLRPTILDDLGLLAALEWQAAQFHKRTGIECMVNCVCAANADCAEKLDKARSIALYRISQEALTNVVKHSGASRVEIEFHRNDEEVVMSIIDNGRGKTTNRTDASIPYGILGMCERVDRLGGKINFDTPPGGGFSVTVILPLPANEEEES